MSQNQLASVLLLPALIGCSPAPSTAKPAQQPSQPTPKAATSEPVPAANIPYKIVQKNEDGSTVIAITTYRELSETRMVEKMGADGKSTFESITTMRPFPNTITIVVPAGVEISAFLASKPKSLSGELELRGAGAGDSEKGGAQALPPAPTDPAAINTVPSRPQ